MIEVGKLTVSYGKNVVLDKLNVRFSPGTIHGILGTNGAGKSTFFNTLYGLKKSEEGSVILNNVPIQKRDVAFLQTDNFFYPLMKGKEYLQLVAPTKNYQQWNDIFQLPLDEFVEDYSTGMKKKIAFMGLILLDREVYILDEPFNGVDLQSNEILIRIIQSLKEKGKYILISSHILSSLLVVSDAIHRLQNRQFDEPILRADFAQFETDFRNEISGEISDKLKNLDF